MVFSQIPAEAANMQVVPGHLPKAVSSLKAAGHLNRSQMLHLAIGLPLRNQAALADLLKQLADPKSPKYRKYLTPAQFAEQFGPTAGDYQKVVDFARANGLVVSPQPSSRMIVDVEGPVSKIETAFHIQLMTYNHPSEARKFFAPNAEPSVTSGLPIVHIGGLDNYFIPHPNLQIKPLGKSAKVTANAGSGPGGTFAAGDFRAAYVPGTILTGAGQTVGLLQFDGYYPSDIANYATQFGLANIPLNNVLVDGGPGTPGSGNAEVCLDIEMVMSMAPGVSSIYVYEAPNNSAYWDDLLSRMANDDTCQELSCSWSGGNPDATAEGIFMQMAAQGQSFFCATGDSDAFTSSIAFPADSPSITQVGGTELTTTGAGGSYVSESVWNWNNGVGSSGGTSTYYAIPSYQQGISMSANLGSTTMRNVPDVALTADNIYVTYNNGSSGNFGGTSCATPLWAAFTALVNQQAAANGRAPVGFLNSSLYSIGKGTGYGSAFHDTTTGNNYSSDSPTKYPAVTGYDLCTGWGSPVGGGMITALAGTPDSLQVTPFNSLSFKGFFGGPFTPTSYTYTLTNAGYSPITWSASATQSWLTVSPSGGTLAAGAAVTVTAALNAGANSLAASTYSNTLTLTNTTSGVQQTRPVSFVVLPTGPNLSLSSSTAFKTSGVQGGPFTPSNATYTVTNAGNQPMNWTVSNSSSWLTASPTGGTLAAGASTTVTASLTAAANSLTLGSYTDSLVFSNISNSRGTITVPCTLAVVKDYFTEQFASHANNSGYHSFTFTPNGSASYYGANCDAATTFPTDPTGGTPLALFDDSYAQVNLTGGASVSLYGTSYTTFYVGSNGYITFGTGDSTASPSLAAHFSQPRISALFEDLNPGASGATVTSRQLSDRVAITYQNVPIFKTNDYNNFQVELFFNGKIRITILAISDAGSIQGGSNSLIGLSQGLGVPSDYMDSTLTGYPATPGPILSVSPSTPFSAAGLPGGPFTPSASTYTISNTGSQSMNWSASNTSTWLTESPASGTLAPGASAPVTVSLTSAANSLTTGIYTDSVSFTNTTNGAGNTAIACSLNAYNPIVLSFPLNTDPGWARQGQWAFGHPTGGGGANGNHDPANGATGTNVFGVNLSGDYSTLVGGPYYLTAGPFNFSAYAGMKLQFQRWLNSDFQPYVTDTVQVSNNGTTWTNVFTNNSGIITDSAWTNVSYDISSVADGQSSVYVRWGYQVAAPDVAPNAYSGWNIDDVVFTGVPSQLSLLTVTTPEDTTTNLSSITIQGTASSANGVASVVANGVAATTSDGYAHWSATVGLTLGLNAITVTATDGSTPAKMASVTRHILEYSSSSSLLGGGLPDAWKIAHGLDPFSNTGVNGPNGNPSGDGTSNLMKYALNLDPQQPQTVGLPYATTAVNPADNLDYLIFNYRQRIGGGGLTYIVEASTDLATWSPTNLQVISTNPDVDGVTNDIQVRVLPSMGSVSPPQTTVIYQDSFTRSGGLNGTVPDVKTIGYNTWSSSSSYTLNGSVVSFPTSATTAGAFLPFTSALLPSTTSGLLTLSADLTATYDGSNANYGWAGLGFAKGNAPIYDGTSGGEEWIVLVYDGSIQAYNGVGTNNPATTTAHVPGVTTASATMKIQLDLAAKTVTYYKGGTLLGTYPFTNPISDFNYVELSGLKGANSTFDNVTVSYTPSSGTPANNKFVRLRVTSP